MDVKFYVAECMEFSTLGTIYTDIPSIEEAFNIYKKIPKTMKTMGNGIGAIIDEAEYPLLYCGIVDELEYYQDIVKNNQVVQDAVSYLKQQLNY